MKTIFITGVNRGLGRELFTQFVAKDYFVYGLLRDEAAYKSMLSGLPITAKLILGDLSGDDVTGKINDAVEGPVHLLINNAGTSGNGVKLVNIRPAEVIDVFNVHCVGVLRVVKALQERLMSAIDPIVVNISSRMGSLACQANGSFKDLPVSYSYRIAKAAQNMLTNCFRVEFGGKIKFISLHPGRMKTRKGQPDADLEPSESARRIIEAWEKGLLTERDGIVELPGKIIPW